jgi:hypothetical protein
MEWAEITGDRDVVVALFDENDAAPRSSRARKHARAVGVRIPAARTSGVLTNRELRVVRLLGEGLSNADIAAGMIPGRPGCCVPTARVRGGGMIRQCALCPSVTHWLPKSTTERS